MLAVVVFGIIALAVFTSSLQSHLTALHLSSNVHQVIEGQRTRLAGITIPTTISAEVQTAIKGALDASFVSAFRLVSLLGAVMALLSALCAGWLIEGKQPEHAGSSVSGPQISSVGADRQAPQTSVN